MEMLLLGILIGFIFGGVSMSEYLDKKIEKGLIPYVSKDGKSILWKEKEE